MRSAWLVGVVSVFMWAASPAHAAVVSVDASGLMDVQAPEGGALRIECSKFPSGPNECKVSFDGLSGVVTGVAPACLPDGLTGAARCTGVSTRNVKMGSGHDSLTVTASSTAGWGALFGGTIDMGEGNDTIHMGLSRGSDVVLADAGGNDTVSYLDRHSDITVSVAGGGRDGSLDLGEADDVHAEVIQGGRGDDTLTDSSSAGTVKILGGEGDDRITGGAGANTLEGQFGHDEIDGGGGDDSITGGTENLPGFIADNDTLHGGAGSDYLNGASHDDKLYGEAGDDQLIPGQGSDPVVSGGDGTDRLRYDLGFSDTKDAVIDLPNGVATRGSETDGLEGLENVNAGNGNDILIGNGESNLLDGAGGADTIDGGDGDDDLRGGDGTEDTLSFASSAGPVVADLGSPSASGAGTDAIAGFENLTGSAGDDELAGDAADNRIDGGAGSDILLGHAGADELVSDDGIADTVNCGAGVDTEKGDRLDEIAECETVDLGPAIELSVKDVTVAEDAGQAAVTVEASGANARAMSVEVTPSAGTAQPVEDFTAASVTATVPKGQLSTQVAIPINDDDLDEEDLESFTVTLSDPVEAAIADGEATVTITDDDTARVFLHDIFDPEEGERVGISAVLTGRSVRDVSVDLATADGTAVGNEDYDVTNATLTIPAGELYAYTEIITMDDALDEPERTFTVTLSNPVNALLDEARASGVVTIKDNDDPPAVSLDAIGDVTEGAAATVTARLATESGFPVSVTLGSTPGSAGAEDYSLPGSPTITIPAGSLTGTLDVSTADDALAEGEETFSVGIVSAEHAVPAGEPRQVRILDNDGDVPALSVADGAVKEGGKLTARLTLSRTSTQPVTVRITTADGTASAPGDYTAFDGTVTIPAGERKANVGIRTTGDKVGEPDETLTVTLSEPVNAALGRPTASMTIQDDDRPRAGASRAGAKPARCVVPKLRGRTVRGARKALARSGCGVRRGVRHRRNSDVRGLRVIRTSRRAGSSLPAGYRLTLYVSRGGR